MRDFALIVLIAAPFLLLGALLFALIWFIGRQRR
jgi:hypothetical protein